MVLVKEYIDKNEKYGIGYIYKKVIYVILDNWEFVLMTKAIFWLLVIKKSIFNILDNFCILNKKKKSK